MSSTPHQPVSRLPLQWRCLDRPGHPAVYRAPVGTWVSVVWTANRHGELTVPQADTGHADWWDAMHRVWTWYRSGKVTV